MSTKRVRNNNNKTVKIKNLVDTLTQEDKKELCKKLPSTLDNKFNYLLSNFTYNLKSITIS